MDTQAKERVAIAKDALKWIKAGALIPTKEVFVNPQFHPALEDGSKQLRDVVLGECQVCAKGALFLAKAVRFDNVLAVNLHAYSDSCRDGGALREHFDFDQLWLIEKCFEGWYELGDIGYEYALHYKSPKQRLIAILQNIVKNEGTFVPMDIVKPERIY